VSKLEGKSVIITGGSKGIGRETARKFLLAGATVTITGRSVNSLKTAIAELKKIGSPVFTVTADVSKEEDCRRTVLSVLKKTGRVDILINNAGMSARGTFDQTSIELYEKMIGINFLGPVMMSRLCLDEIKKNKGSIVYISTIAALKGIPGLSHYGSSKMPLTAFSEAIRGELKSAGVHVSTIYVGFTSNDPDKTIYDALGNEVPILRNKYSLSQEYVASAVLNSVLKRKKRIILSILGKTASFFYRYFPGISEIFLAKNALNSPMYKVDK